MNHIPIETAIKDSTYFSNIYKNDPVKYMNMLSDNSYLVYITSDEENQFLEKMTLSRIWIGGRWEDIIVAFFVKQSFYMTRLCPSINH